MKNVNVERDVEASKLEKFRHCKLIATKLAGKIIQGAGGEKDVVGQFLLTQDYMKSLEPSKLVQFIKDLTSPSSQSGADAHPLGVRCAAVDDALRLLSHGTTEFQMCKNTPSIESD